MIAKIKKKIFIIMGISPKSWDKENRSFYRLVKFIFSAKGQKKIGTLFLKIITYSVKKIAGIDFANYDYMKWRKKNIPTLSNLEQFKKLEKTLTFRPKISIVLPVYNPPENYFREAINSVINQVYTNWELCISDDVSPNENIRKIIKEYAEKDNRIKYVFRTENGHISANSNTAIEIATGDYIGLLDHDDLLAPEALYENVLALNKDKTLDFIYSDEDKINEKGKHFDPHFKPDFCKYNLLTRNYICHFSVIKAELIKQVKGFRIGYEGSQDFDLFLRCTELAKKIHHIPKILYHWRVHSESTALNMDTKPYATNAALKALTDTLKRNNIDGKVDVNPNLAGFYKISYHIDEKPKISILIPSKNLTKITNTCISSIFKLTDYPNFEVILINNNSNEDAFFSMAKSWEKQEPNRFKCVHDNADFNFSRLINFGASQATGSFLVLLNNDTEVIDGKWLTNMIEYAQIDDVGAVGVKLLYPNNTIQHAGVIIGLQGIAGHVFVGKSKDEVGYFNYLKSVNNFCAITAACLMVRKSYFNEVNGFEETLAVEFNDVDFCLKLAEKGKNNIYLPHVELYHYESISRGHPHKTKESYERHLIENAYFKKKWQKYIDHDPCYNPNLSLTYDDFRIRTN